MSGRLRLDGAVDDRRQLDPLLPELNLAAGDAADVEQVVDQTDQVSRPAAR